MDSAAAAPDQALSELPEFSLEGYAGLLATLRRHGIDMRPVSAMPDVVQQPVAYLRHDIDLHVPGVERIAAIEAELGVRATYYVLITQHYNPLYPANRAVLRQLVDLGHEIGLHYDLTTYPTDEAAALEHLEWELGILSAVVGCSVRTISMHQPFEGRPDVLRGVEGYIHPHDPRFGDGLTYVSDSCRAWRDESLVHFVGSDNPRRRLLLLTHPEVWLDGTITDRTEFLETTLMRNAVAQHRDFIDETVRGVWERHPGPVLHDKRQARRLFLAG
jgi:hypothetical protein